MNHHILQSIRCSSCGSPIDLNSKNVTGNQVRCDACGSVFVLRGHVCPYCGTYHEQEVNFCRQCGVALTRRCAQCDTVNWIGDEHCKNCGAPLDILEIIVKRHNTDTKDRLIQQMNEVSRIKQSDAEASEARFARMLEEEREQQIALQRRRLEQKKNEQKAFIIAIVAALVILGIFITLAVVGTG